MISRHLRKEGISSSFKLNGWKRFSSSNRVTQQARSIAVGNTLLGNMASKLHAPRPRPHPVHRPRLLQRLQQGREGTLTVLSAPAGFGRSSLLGDWLSSCAIPAAWLALEPQDDDPARFLSYLLAALQTYDPHLGACAQALPHPLPSPALEAVLSLLSNELLERRAGEQEQVVLVLDNYHVISNGSIHHALGFLLEHLPPCLHVVLATREDPPLPLVRAAGALRRGGLSYAGGSCSRGGRPLDRAVRLVVHGRKPVADAV